MIDEPTSLDLVDVALRLAAYFDTHQHAYAFGGALALGFWGVPRGTLDVDVTLFVANSEPDEMVAILQEAGCSLSHSSAMLSLHEHGFCRVNFRGIPLDIFLPTIPFYEQARARRRTVTLRHQPICIWDAETLCVFKMMFFRLKDLADVEQIIQVQGDRLDRSWVRDQIIAIHGPRDPRVARWGELAEPSTPDR
jgi:hypothetical protein